LDVYREGMVDLVSANLDGLSSFRAIDARTVLARWNREIGATADAELDAALRVAASTGARYAVVGSGVEVGGQVRFTADIYDLSDGSKVGDGGQVQGAPDDVLSLVDALTVAVMRSLLDATDRASGAQTFRLASLLTESVPALRHYLVGDASFRRGQFADARESLERAVAEDSTFALAYWRLGETIGWVEGVGNAEGRAAKRRAKEYGERLPDREATLLDVGAAIADGRGDREIERLRTYLRRYPDDPDGWYLLGEAGLHSWVTTGVTDAELQEALYRAVELDPAFGPFYVHATQWTSAKGDEVRFRAFLGAWDAMAFDADRRSQVQMRWDLLQGDDATVAAAIVAMGEMVPRDVVRLDQAALGIVDKDLERLVPMYERRGGETRGLLLNLYIQQGRLAEAIDFAGTDAGLAGRVLVASVILKKYESGDASRDELAGAFETIREGDPGLDIDAHFARAFVSLALGDMRALEAMRPTILSAVTQTIEQGAAAGFDTTAVYDAFAARLESRRLSAQGDPAAGYRLLSQAASATLIGLGFELAQMAMDAGQWPDAIPILEGISRNPQRRSEAKFLLGKAYEESGDRERALDAYRTFLSRWERADPELTWLREARDAVARLGG